MTVAVTGASGQLGQRVADLLLARLDPGDVVLLTRSAETLAAHAVRGATVRRASEEVISRVRHEKDQH